MATRATTGYRPPPVWLVTSIRLIVRHWLALFNVGMALFATLPFLAPVLLAAGYTTAANAIYMLYSLTCHQMPERAWHILGHQMAYCERNTAIYLAMFVAGFVYARRRPIRALHPALYVLLIAPMAVDGFTQLVGWRESTWYLRTLTGSLFGLATIWLVYPLLDRNLAEVASEFSSD